MEIGRRPGAPASRTKDFIHCTGSSMSINIYVSFFFSCFHDPDECYVCSRFVLQLRNTEFDEPSVVSTVIILAL